MLKFWTVGIMGGAPALQELAIASPKKDLGKQ
jgi:hypothetical protein